MKGTIQIDNKLAVGFEFRTISNALKRAIDVEVEKKVGNKVTSLQGRIIGYISKNGDRDVFQRDLEANFNVSRATMTAILSAMEKNGLLTRTRMSDDARLKKLTLTEKANELFSEIRSTINGMEERVFSGITDGEMAELGSIFGKIKSNLADINERNNK